MSVRVHPIVRLQDRSMCGLADLSLIGDVLLTAPAGKPNLFQCAVQRAQWNTPGATMGYMYTHARLVLGNLLLSATWPRTILEPLKTDEPTWILQRPKWQFPPKALPLIRYAGLQLVGTHYDPGQIIDHIWWQLWGARRALWRRVFDFSDRMHVCSVVPAYCWEYARSTIEARETKSPWTRPFWDAENRKPLPIESIMPADYCQPRWMYTVARRDQGGPVMIMSQEGR